MFEYAHNVYSQNGEDGIVSHILECLNLSQDGFCCEFGSWCGRHLSNTFNLVESSGYKAVYIEADEAKYDALLQTATEHQTITAVLATVTENNLDQLLANTGIPFDFEVLSIDVDGPDLQIWRGLRHYRPKLVIIEVESSWPPGVLREHTPDADISGSSFSSMLALGRKKGYTFVHHTGNMFFVVDELAHLISGPDNPEDRFTRTWLSVESSKTETEFETYYLVDCQQMLNCADGEDSST